MVTTRSRQLKFGAIISYVSIAINLIAGLVYTPWMIKQIGQSEYGLYTLANSLISLFILDFGLSQATARYISKYLAEDHQEKVNNFLGVIYKLYLIIDAIIFVILAIVFCLVDKIYVNLTPNELSKFKVVFIIAALFSVVNFPFITYKGILTAYEQFIQLKLADIIYRCLIVGLTVVALSIGMGLYALVTVNAIAGLLTILYKFIVIRKFTPARPNFRYSSKFLYKDILGFSVWTTISALATRLVFTITPTILGIVSNTTEIAIFGVISTIEGYVFTFTSAISGMFMPKIAKIYASSKPGEAEKNIMPLFIKVGRFQFALNGLMIVGFVVVGKAFIDLWMGADYVDAYWGIILVILPGLFYNSLQIAHSAIVIRKKVSLNALINIVTGIINVALSFIFSKMYGVIGASLAICCAYTIRAILTFIIDKIVMRFDMWLFAKKCYFRMAGPMLIATALSICFCNLIQLNGWLGLIIKASIVTLTYLLITYTNGLDIQEQKNVIEKIKSVFQRRK